MGPTRSSEKSEVPPPMSATSTQLLVHDALLMVQRRGNRLVLEVDFLEAGLAGTGLQHRLRTRVARRIVVDEVHRPAEHGASHRHAGARLGQPPQVPQVAGHDVAVAHLAAAADIGGLLDQGRPEDALHRPHQPALLAFDVGRHGSAAIASRQPALILRRVGQVEHGGRHGLETRFQFDQGAMALPIADHDGRVGGAEVDGGVGRGAGHSRVRPARSSGGGDSRDDAGQPQPPASAPGGREMGHGGPVVRRMSCPGDRHTGPHE
jgi:hypothetical protein